DPQGAGDADAARGEGAAHALRHRREVRPHAGRGGSGLRGHARAHPADRGEGAAQAAPPVALEAAKVVHGVVSRRFAVKIDGKDKETLVEIDDGGVISVDGQPVDVALRQAEPGVWILRRGDEQTVAQVDGRGGKLAVEIRRPGRDAVVVAADVSDARRASIATPARAAAGGAPITVRSPIPGRL